MYLKYITLFRNKIVFIKNKFPVILMDRENFIKSEDHETDPSRIYPGTSSDRNLYAF